jgi:hypothetical protein
LQDDEEIMVKRRRRFKQTTTLAERLAQEANRLRERAQHLSAGPEQTELWRKVRQAETALRIDAWLASPGELPPENLLKLDNDEKTYAASKSPVKSA